MTADQPTLHLIHGYIGAGKTSFAKKLEHELNCVRFTSDEWVIALYGDNPPQDKFRDYEDRIKVLIWQVAKRILETGNDVILDLGVWKRSERDKWRAIAKEMSVGFKLYNVTCPLEIAKQRTLQRTHNMPAGALVIDENAFDTLQQYFEPIDPSVEECITIDTSKS